MCEMRWLTVNDGLFRGARRGGGLGLGSAAAPWRVRAQMKGVAALLAWVVFVCAVIGLGGTWLYLPTLGIRAYLWGACLPDCNSYFDSSHFVWNTFTTVLVLQAVSLVLVFHRRDRGQRGRLRVTTQGRFGGLDRVSSSLFCYPDRRVGVRCLRV